MTILPDTADWTWVLERPCPDCGFDATVFPAEKISPALEGLSDAWADILTRRSSQATRTRTRPDRWSALEYGCHVRDMFRTFDTRLCLMLTADDPPFENWDQDRTAVDDRYMEQDPAVVAVEVRQAGRRLASHYSQVPPGGWDRPGRRSDGSRFSVLTLGRYMLHDPVHHLWDVGAPVEM